MADHYHHGMLRPALLDRAEAVLASGPVEALSLRRLNADLGVSATAHVSHFPTKADLLAALGARGFGLLGEAMSTVTGNTRTRNPRTVMTRLAHAYLDFAAARPGLYRVMFQAKSPAADSMGDGNAAASVSTEAGRRAFDGFQAIIAGLLPPTSRAARVREAALVAWSLVHGLAVLSADGRLPPGMPADRAALARIAGRAIVEGIFTGPRKMDTG